MEKTPDTNTKKVHPFLPKILALPAGFSCDLISLRFDEKTEKEFTEKSFHDSVAYIRVSLILAILLYGIFSILDYNLAPDLFCDFFLIRFSIVIPLMLFVYFFSFNPKFGKYYQFLMNLIFLSAGAGMTLMVYIAEDSSYTLISRLYSLAIILVFFFGYIFLKIKFTWASLSGWILFGMISILLIKLPNIPTNHKTSIIFFLFSANCMGIVGSYLNELNLRKQFFAQKQLDQEKKKVQRMNQELEKKLKVRTSDLKEAKNKAKESDKLKTAFLANMSHEIRTPMNGILGFTEILLNEEVDKNRRIKYLKIIHERANYLMNFLNNIIEISLIESKQLKFYYAQIELNAFLHQLYKSYSPLFHENNITFFLNLERKEELIIESDQEKLEKIINHYLANALKFTSKGKVTLGYTFINDKLRIYVKDTGPGIPESQKDYIFQRFTKYEKDQEEYKYGTGLGLSISKGLAKFLDGETGFISRKGEGTIFYVDFSLIEIMQMEEEIKA